MSWLWHGFNMNKEKRRKQCYYEWHCLVCWIKLLLLIIRLALMPQTPKEKANGAKN